jgi:hypothetical protein
MERPDLTWQVIQSRYNGCLEAPGRRLSESRMRKNLMSGSMWQGMKTRHGDGTEALSEEMESNGSATPKSSHHPLTLPLDAGDSAAFSSIFLASSFSCSPAESTPAPPPLTQTVSPQNRVIAIEIFIIVLALFPSVDKGLK